MVKEYIEREAAIAKIKDKINKYQHNSNPYWTSSDDYIAMGLREAIEIIDEYTPTADVQEVRHGKWIYVDGVLDWADYKCSKCGYIQKFGDDTCFYNYCPECGAKMDKE